MSSRSLLRFVYLLAVLIACDKDEPAAEAPELIQIFMGSTEISLAGSTTDVPVDQPIALRFSQAVQEASAAKGILLQQAGRPVGFTLTFSNQHNTVVLYPNSALLSNTLYTLVLTENLRAENGAAFPPLEIEFRTAAGTLALTSVALAGETLGNEARVDNVTLRLNMVLHFSVPVHPASLQDALQLSGPGSPAFNIRYTNEQKTAEITTTQNLAYLSKYEFTLNNALKGVGGESFAGYAKTLYTQIDSTYKFPEISEEALLTKVQEHTFRYFWDFAHPSSGLARERNTSGDVVTSGGSGFGIMAILVGIERGFITRQQGVDRLQKIVNFLKTADRFHGAWPHWLHGTTGKAIPFSAKDDGGDLVETAFLVQGLLTAREYLNSASTQEAAIRQSISQLWEEVEWDWYTRGGEQVLYWHWSPTHQWEMNHPIRGWNEALIVYVLAAASPTHGIDPQVYHQGWARGGNIRNGSSYYGIRLPLGEAFGGPLFFAHYSFLGLDPRKLQDQYANYWEQNVNHSQINQQHAIANPLQYVGYGATAWGFTASDNQLGYAAHSPSHDLGVITPTAALSSMPYTPDASGAALRHFYYLMGDKIWGEWGFTDAYNPTAQWYASSYLAIDQGPILLMIENHRTGLLWNHFMQAPEVKAGLDKLGFSYE